MAAKKSNRRLRLKTWDRFVYRRKSRSIMDARWVLMLFIFLISIMAIAFSPARSFLLLLAGPLSLIFSTEVFNRYHMSRLGFRGVLNLVLLTALTLPLITLGLLFGLLPGFLLGTLLIFSQPLVIYRRAGLQGALGGSVRITKRDFSAYLALWLYSELLVLYGMLSITGIRKALPEALILRKIAFCDAMRNKALHI